MRITLLSDAHLSSIADPVQTDAVAFLRVWHSDVWVFAGDWFDFWWGHDSYVDGRFVPFLSALAAVRERGEAVCWVRGNRDFAAGGWLERVCGRPAQDVWETVSGGKRLLATHGDQAELRLSHRVWSRVARSAALEAVVRGLGPAVVGRIGRWMGGTSRAMGDPDPTRILDSQRRFVDVLLGAADVVFTGHSHAPGTEVRPAGTWVNLGDWLDHRSFATVDDGVVALWHWDGAGAIPIEGEPRRRPELRRR